MESDKLTLSKAERISRKLIIDRLFSEGKSFVVYPFRVVYLTDVEHQDADVAILVSVSKKRFKRAVKRNFIKRRVKECFRLNKSKIILGENVKHLSIAFLYLSSDLKSFEQLFPKMEEVVEQLNSRLCSEHSL